MQVDQRVEAPRGDDAVVLVDPNRTHQAPTRSSSQCTDLGLQLLRQPPIVVVTEGHMFGLDRRQTRSSGQPLTAPSGGVDDECSLSDIDGCGLPAVVDDDRAGVHAFLGGDGVQRGANVIPSGCRNHHVDRREISGHR